MPAGPSREKWGPVTIEYAVLALETRLLDTSINQSIFLFLEE